MISYKQWFLLRIYIYWKHAHYEPMYRASTDERTGWLGRDDCCASQTKIKFIQQMYGIPSLLVPPTGDLKYGK